MLLGCIHPGLHGAVLAQNCLQQEGRKRNHCPSLTSFPFPSQTSSSKLGLLRKTQGQEKVPRSASYTCTVHPKHQVESCWLGQSCDKLFIRSPGSSSTGYSWEPAEMGIAPSSDFPVFSHSFKQPPHPHPWAYQVALVIKNPRLPMQEM